MDMKKNVRNTPATDSQPSFMTTIAHSTVLMSE